MLKPLLLGAVLGGITASFGVSFLGVFFPGTKNSCVPFKMKMK
jgi:hypothetical protein